MKQSELRQALNEEFGTSYASVLASDLVLGSLGGRTPNAAISAGEQPRVVWLALCRELGVPEERWYGAGRPEPQES
ncbi:DUF3046 domain-containing protein [Okibacterium endophyticum]